MDRCAWTVNELLTWAASGQLDRYLAPRLEIMSPALSDKLDASQLRTLLEASGKHRRFLSALLMASVLLHGAPDDVWNSLAYELKLPTQWHEARWRMARVPCEQHGTAVLRTVLCGWNREALEAAPPAEGMQDDTCEALRLACRLTVQTWGGHAVCWHWSGLPVSGPSFGLPVYLALASAAADIPVPALLATGRLKSRLNEPTGGIGKVEFVGIKAGLAAEGCMLAPADDFTANSVPAEACVLPVQTASDAWKLWRRCAQGANPRILNTLRSAQNLSGQFLAMLQRCSLPELHFALEDLRRLRSILWSDPDSAFREMRLLIRHITTSPSSSREARQLRQRLLRALPIPDLVRVADAGHPATAWHLAMLHVRELNHGGHPDKALNLLQRAQTWEYALPAEDSADEFISHALTVVGVQHNRYAFKADPLQDCPAQVHHMIAAAENRLQRGQRDNKPLGDWYGTLGQHHAFAGNLDLARDYLDRALRCFSSPDDILKNQSYRFFLSLETGENEQAAHLLTGMLPAGLDAALTATASPWHIFPALRFIRDTGAEGHQETLHGLGEALLQGTLPAEHPWQLILYNLALLVGQRHLAARLLRAALRICVSRKLGPTVRVMTLLPLAALRRLDLPLPANARDRVETIRGIIRAENFDADHFACVLQAPTWQKALDATSANERQLFPFNYR